MLHYLTHKRFFFIFLSFVSSYPGQSGPPICQAHSTIPALAHPGSTSELESFKVEKGSRTAISEEGVTATGRNAGIENNDLVLRVESNANRFSVW